MRRLYSCAEQGSPTGIGRRARLSESAEQGVSGVDALGIFGDASAQHGGAVDMYVLSQFLDLLLADVRDRLSSA